MKRAFKIGIAIINGLIGSWDIGQNVLQVRETNYTKSHFFFERFSTLFFGLFFCEITQKWQCSQHGDQYSWGYYYFLWCKPLHLDPDSNTLPTQTLKMLRKLANRIKNCKTPTSRICSQNV